MDFFLVKKFEHSALPKDTSKFKRDNYLKIQCSCLSFEDQTLTLGLSNGQIMQFKKKNEDQKFLTTGKQYMLVPPGEEGHKGEIRSLISVRIFNRKYMITGSVDRTIKIWDNEIKGKTFDTVVQTLVGHQGSVLALNYSAKIDTLFSVSNDKTLRIWRQEEGRQLMFHPWFTCRQIIQDFSPRKGFDHIVYINSLVTKFGENLTLYGGDTEGNIHLFKPESWKADSSFVLEKTISNFHRLTIISIISIDKDNSVFTIGYDQKIKAFEETSGKQFFSYKNPHKCLFTSICWDSQHQELISCDELGHIYFINVHSDSGAQEFKFYSQKILKIEIIEQLSQLLIVCENFVDVVRIKRTAKQGNIIDGHSGPIIGLEVVDPGKLSSQQSKDPAKLVSASLDNTIRTWDPKDMSSITILDNKDGQEISALTYLPHSNLFATGHETGDIKLWNVESGNCITLMQKNTAAKHTNTICCLCPGFIVRKTVSSEEITEYLFSSGFDGKVNIWEISEKKQAQQNSYLGAMITPQIRFSFYPKRNQIKEEIGEEIFALIFDKSNDRIIAAGNAALIYIFEMFNAEPHAVLKGHLDSINCLAMDNYYLFSGSDDLTIRIWEAKNCYFLFKIDRAHEMGIKDLIIIEETGHLISCAFDGKIHIWDYKEKKREKTFEKKETFRCLTYIFSEKTLIAGTEENNIYCFEINEIFDMNIKNHELKFLEKEDEKFDDEDHSVMKNSSRSLSKMGSADYSIIDYILPPKKLQNGEDSKMI